MDLAGAGMLVAFLSPVLAAIALAIRVRSPGPVLFRQRRLGLAERPFEILKFRTMVVDADKIGPTFTSGGDRRITGIGRFLRRTSLDELPQLFNVLRGEMSLLGPRPCVGFELERRPAHERALRSSVLPGISGLAQVRGRSTLSEERSFAYDLEYVRRVSLAFDLRLLLETVLVVLRQQGSN